MVRADARGQITVERHAEKQRRMAVDMAALEGGQFCQDARIFAQHAGEIHHFRQPDHFGMVRNGRRSSISSRAPAVSRFVAGTQEDRFTLMSMTVRSAQDRK